MTMSKFIWALKQLLPFTYASTYWENGSRWVTVWKSWFGRCYRVRTWKVAPNITHYIIDGVKVHQGTSWASE